MPLRECPKTVAVRKELGAVEVLSGRPSDDDPAVIINCDDVGEVQELQQFHRGAFAKAHSNKRLVIGKEIAIGLFAQWFRWPSPGTLRRLRLRTALEMRCGLVRGHATTFDMVVARDLPLGCELRLSQ
jgi:hypothetical protein